MTTRAVLLLTACLAAAGCHGTPTAPANEAQAAAENRAPDLNATMTDRWNKLFADPKAVVATANEFGYKAGALQATGATPAYRITGASQTLPAPDAPVTVTTSFDATSASADKVDAVTFTFTVHDNGDDDTKAARDTLKTPYRIVSGFLSRFDVSPGDAIHLAMIKGKSATIAKYGATIAVEAGVGDKPTTVRIFKTGAAAPAQPHDQAPRK